MRNGCVLTEKWDGVAGACVLGKKMPHSQLWAVGLLSSVCRIIPFCKAMVPLNHQNTKNGVSACVLRVSPGVSLLDDYRLVKDTLESSCLSLVLGLKRTRTLLMSLALTFSFWSWPVALKESFRMPKSPSLTGWPSIR